MTLDHPDLKTFDAYGDDVIIDQWLANSLLQKAIRRGDVLSAERAALIFYRSCGSAIWRRFIIIAFEDIGIADLGVVTEVTELAANSKMRRAVGGNQTVIRYLARSLALAIKSRSAEHLITSVLHHPRLPHREALQCSVWVALDHAKQVLTAAGNGMDGLPSDLEQISDLGLRRSGEAIVQMTPVLWKSVLEAKLPMSIERREIPEARRGGLPLYALDKHTRKGRLAIRQFVRDIPEIRNALAHTVKPSMRNNAAYMIAFYTDAVPLAEKLVWPGAQELEQLGLEADMYKVGVNPTDIAPLLAIFSKFQSELDDARARTLSTSVTDLPLFKMTASVR